MHQLAIIRLLWCAFGVAVAITAVLFVVEPPASPFLLASLGGSSIFLFGLTRAPAAQPRALFGGHLGTALIGISCYQLFGNALWVYALAQALAVIYLLATRTVHPPSGANPMIMIYSHATFLALWQPVFTGLLCLVGVAVVWSRLYPGLVHYPLNWTEKSPHAIFAGGWGK